MLKELHQAAFGRLLCVDFGDGWKLWLHPGVPYRWMRLQRAGSRGVWFVKGVPSDVERN